MMQPGTSSMLQPLCFFCMAALVVILELSNVPFASRDFSDLN
jgi:hypothetical protein